MQPYLFPYLSYFELFNVDEYVHYDSAAFSKNSWQNRNRIKDGRGGWTYIGFSIRRSPLGTPINEIRLADKARDTRRLLGQLDVYRHSPFHREVIGLVRTALDVDSDRLVEVTVASLEHTIRYLGVSPTIRRSSNLDADFTGTAEEKVLAVCGALGATRYLNLSGGRTLYDPERFRVRGIDLAFTSAEPIVLANRPDGETFSIIDTMMDVGPQAIVDALSRRAS